MKLLNSCTLSLALVLATGCPGGGQESASDTDAGSSGNASNSTDPTGGQDCSAVMVPAIDESSCMPLATDYMPRTNMSADDTWPACISDSGMYTLVAGTPGAQARIDAYEKIADALWRKQDPTPDDFTFARDQYVIPEGLESRISRREDLHEDPIPMDDPDWDPQVDADKQCTVAAIVAKYPKRCIGPTAIQPILDEAFAAGQAGTGDANINAARIHGALVWFIYLSTYKEANTCATETAEDCDATWAYYTGGQSIDAGIGMSAEVKAQSVTTHERIHDAILAVRCWRDLNKGAMSEYPLLPDLPQDQVDLFNQGWEQLDQGLHRGFAVVLRGHMQAYVDAACAGTPYAAEWAFLQAAAKGLQSEAERRDATNAAVLADLWAKAEPTAAEVAAGITALDTIFPCT